MSYFKRFMKINSENSLKNKIITILNYGLNHLFLLFGINLKNTDKKLTFNEKLLQIKNSKIRKPYGYDTPIWLNDFIENLEEIINEWNNYVMLYDKGIQIDELSIDQRALNLDKKWKSILLFSYSYYNHRELKYFETLHKLIKKHSKQINLVMFSTTESGKQIPSHNGNNHCVLRAQIGIDIKEPDKCMLRVVDKKIFLKEKECFIFDDTFEHELINTSSTYRTVLIIDYFKPLPFWYKKINKKKVMKMKNSEYVQNVIKKFD